MKDSRHHPLASFIGERMEDGQAIFYVKNPGISTTGPAFVQVEIKPEWAVKMFEYDDFEPPSDRFDWGNETPESLLLSFAILLEATNDDTKIAIRHYEAFLQDHVKGFSEQMWGMSQHDVRGWVLKQETSN